MSNWDKFCSSVGYCTVVVTACSASLGISSNPSWLFLIVTSYWLLLTYLIVFFYCLGFMFFFSVPKSNFGLGSCCNILFITALVTAISFMTSVYVSLGVMDRVCFFIFAFAGCFYLNVPLSFEDFVASGWSSLYSIRGAWIRLFNDSLWWRLEAFLLTEKWDKSCSSLILFFWIGGNSVLEAAALTTELLF